LAAAFDAAAWENQVYPLDEGSGWRWIVRRPDDADYEAPVTIFPGTPTLNRWRCNRLIWNRNVHITISLEHAEAAAGVLLAHGDQGGGYSVWVDDGQLTVSHNDGHGTTQRISAGSLATGSSTINVDLLAPGQRLWNLVVSVNGETRVQRDGLTMLFPMAPFEGINVGTERRSPVDWALSRQHGPFAYSGTLHWVRYEPGEPAPDGPARYIDMLKKMGAKYE
jgi:arylsulfatase